MTTRSPQIASRPRSLPSLAAMAALLTPNERVFLPGATGEPHGLTDQLLAPEAPPLDVTWTFIPGINRQPLDRLPDGTRVTSLFGTSNRPAAQQSGRLRHLPMSYGAFVRHLTDHLSFDTTIVHVSPPDADGNCSLGPAVEVTPLAVSRSRRVLAVINSRMPRLMRGVTLPFAGFTAVAEIDAPLRTYDVGPPTPEADAIARTIAGFVTDGATIEIGLGKVPAALMARLVDRKNLKLFSGMLSDGARALAESGSLDPDFAHTCCVHVGSHAYYDWLDGRGDFVMRGSEHTHAIPVLATHPNLIAVNSALSVDLFGQANLEMLGVREVSGTGGAPDFARAATLSVGGISMIALQSTAGVQSRIVPRLDGIVSIQRNDVHIVVTEHGAADLRGLSVMERAEPLIAVAAPQHRADLTEAWREIAHRL